jgi:NAD(P)-dependent dehydrogenase (short-subunit alcohol dehydrogenase family)
MIIQRNARNFSGGIGFATAKPFVQEGAFVFIIVRRRTESDKLPLMEMASGNGRWRAKLRNSLDAPAVGGLKWVASIVGCLITSKLRRRPKDHNAEVQTGSG